MWNRAPGNRYELLTCAMKGHCFVGVGSKKVSDADALVVRELGALRWHRCLRCDSWVPFSLPETPAMDRVPTRDEIELPIRGPRLRDRYVLRIIALDRLFHVLILVGFSILVMAYLGHRAVVERDYTQVMNALTGGQPKSGGIYGVLAHLRHYLFEGRTHLYEVVVVALSYAVLEATEMVGLWFAKRWAEYLTFVATIFFIPLEVLELTRGLSVLKLSTFIINVAIAAYLLVAKRLFGIRGGHRAVIARRTAGGGWQALERASAPASVTPSTVAVGD